MSVNDDAVWMTSAALEKLEQELAELTRHERAQDQPRIAELRNLIRRAEVGTKPDDGLVEPGMTITVRFDSDEPETFLLGSRDLLSDNTEDLTVFSPTSPMGQAITGRSVGDRVDYVSPSGAAISVEIIAASPYQPAS